MTDRSAIGALSRRDGLAVRVLEGLLSVQPSSLVLLELLKFLSHTGRGRVVKSVVSVLILCMKRSVRMKLNAQLCCPPVLVGVTGGSNCIGRHALLLDDLALADVGVDDVGVSDDLGLPLAVHLKSTPEQSRPRSAKSRKRERGNKPVWED